MGALPVYVVHWDAPEWCAEAVRLLEASDIAVTVKVVDNSGNFDDTAGTVHRPPNNLGYAGGANIGIEEWLAASDSEWCAVASHDVAVAPDSLSRMLQDGARDPAVGLVGLDPSGDGSWVSGTLMLLRRPCIEEIGGFETAFGSYMEDRELCLRAGDHGWKVLPRTYGVSGHGHRLDRARRVEQIVPNELLMWSMRGQRARMMGAVLRFAGKSGRHAAIAVITHRRVHVDVARAYALGIVRGVRKVRRHGNSAPG